MAFDGSMTSVTIGGMGSGQLAAHAKPPVGEESLGGEGPVGEPRA